MAMAKKNVIDAENCTNIECMSEFDEFMTKGGSSDEK